MGAHALHFNADTIGIGLMGDYSNVAPTTAMIDALITLLTWKCARWGIDPLGAAPYVNSQGARVTGLANICGHRDTYATACPGATVEAMLPQPARRRSRRAVAIGSDRLLDRVEHRAGARVRQPAQRRRRRRPRGCSAPILGIGGAPDRARATGCSAATAACSRSATPSSTARPAAGASTSRSSGMAPTPSGQRLLARRPRRRRVLLRRREVLRLDRRAAAELAGARPHADVDRQGLLAVRARRRRLLLRRREVLRLDGRRAAEPADRRHGRASAERRLLDGRGRRRHLHVRARAVPRLGREPAAVRAVRVDHAVDDRQRATRCCSPTARCCRSATCRTSAARPAGSSAPAVGLAGKPRAA